MRDVKVFLGSCAAVALVSNVIAHWHDLHVIEPALELIEKRTRKHGPAPPARYAACTARPAARPHHWRQDFGLLDLTILSRMKFCGAQLHQAQPSFSSASASALVREHNRQTSLVRYACQRKA